MQTKTEAEAALHVGRLIFSFARLDHMLALALRNIAGTTEPDILNPMIERLGFKERLDSLRELVAGSNLLDPEAVQQFEGWYKDADKLRQVRNAFVHGRWGMQDRQTLFNASTKPGKAMSGEGRIYTINELEAQALFSAEVIDAFDLWHRKHVIGS